MTTSFWDSQEIGKQFRECSTLKEIIARLETDFSLKGEVICEIRVNGILLSEDDEVKFASHPRETIQEISIASNRPGDLISQALASADVFVPELDKACLRTAEKLRGADLPAAQASFRETIEGCQWFVDTLMHVRGAASGIEKPISNPALWFEAEKMITQVIREVSEAYGNEDYVLVADLLEYELTGTLAVWKNVLDTERPLRA
jgi:hypothetical protein